MKNVIKNLFEKQLLQIQSKELRKKVVNAWVLGCERGGWNSKEELLKIPFTLLTNCHGINFIEHTIAVTEGAIKLAKVQIEVYKSELPYKINFDRLIVCGLLHDVGKLLEIEKIEETGEYKKSLNGKLLRHPFSGILLGHDAGLEDEYLNSIACHAKEGDGRPQLIETIFIHQADFATFNPLVMFNNGSLINL